MRRTAIALISIVTLFVASAATAQSFKQRKDGKYEVTMPDGETMVVDQKGNLERNARAKSKDAKDDSGAKTLELGKKAEKKPRKKSGPQQCGGPSDLLVEHAIIGGVDTGVGMATSCDADVFNSEIEGNKYGIDVAGSGDLRVSDSEVWGGEVGVKVTGSGDAIVEDSIITGPIAFQVTGTGNVVLKNSKVYGKIVITGTGKLIDEGGNTLVEDHNKASSNYKNAERGTGQ